jgi:murein L,D-transpeptidase YafK
MKYILALLLCLGLGLHSKVAPNQIFIRVFKYEKEIEVWSYKGGAYELIKTYNICGLSGGFGPKRYEGDLQVPEGLYEVTRLNPHSNYHKAIKINYPNKSDSILSSYSRKGGEIYIHGKCVSIGCIAIGDKAIDELYRLINQPSKTIVYIFPVRYDKHNEYYLNSLKYQPELRKFETNLAQFYYYFEDNKVLPSVEVDSNGKYLIR